MQIRVLKFLILETGRTGAATIFIRAVGTVEVLRVCERKLQLTYSGNAREELGMRNTSVSDGLAQLLLGRFLSYDVGK